ncbi:hypothetical protein LTR48_007007 [Friedmanniomyces endolithicus]|uniref:Uncharacterized protein n=1 Tax=Rachicladosporium monterosium TaxID=1507873 RepID=A0ABR0KXD2_9PEZI|nr:hypothetical protein LTR29_010160 [Friedmanniomyces endolithicus]KAK1082381.1 hypothetical protein LTR48_007007 [Friedmanniomyces endolithicus]KAK5140107.1 hypothetical protein LTR32_006998 [Rachicladosporium monterosium]
MWKANLLRFHYPVELYPEPFVRLKAIAPEKDGAYEAVKSKKEYRTLSPNLEEATEGSEDATDTLDNGDDLHEATLAARTNPAAEDMVVVTGAEEEEEIGVEEEDEDGAEEGGFVTEHGQTEKGAYSIPIGAYCSSKQMSVDPRAEMIDKREKQLGELKWRIATHHLDLFSKDKIVIFKIVDIQAAATHGDRERYQQLEEGLMEYLDNGEFINQTSSYHR